jgi:hypothetical protein
MDTNPSETTKRIAATVSSALKDAGVSQEVAADRTGIPLTTLKRRLRGVAAWKTPELEAVAALVGMTFLEIVVAAEDAA